MDAPPERRGVLAILIRVCVLVCICVCIRVSVLVCILVCIRGQKAISLPTVWRVPNAAP